MSTATPQVTGRVLVVDDDRSVATVLTALLQQRGHEAVGVSSAAAALAALDESPFDVVLTDLRMPGMDGMGLLAAVRARWPSLPVILLTAHGTVAAAVEAMKQGATDFLLKPFEREDVIHTIDTAVIRARHRDGEAPEIARPVDELVGEAPAMVELKATLARLANHGTTVLLLGDSGTGKELAAHAIHQGGSRRDGPFVVVNCAALPENLLESELFGHEKGAFTGASAKKPGRVALADGGTLFLDEIGDLPLAMQAKVLRVIQEREITPVGSTRVEKVDVRFVAATHRDLAAMVRDGTFREDLFFRLNVVPVRMPTLAERRADVPMLARRFLSSLAAREGIPCPGLDADGALALERAPWPGNVRQLLSFVERLLLFSDGAVVSAADVAREFARDGANRPFVVGAPSGDPAAVHAVGSGGGSDGVPPDGTLDEHRRHAERAALTEALARAGGNRTRAARLLGISRRTLYNKLDQLEG